MTDSLELLLYSAEGTVIMPSMSPPSSGTVVSLEGGLESVALLTPPPGTPPSRHSPSPPRASLALRFLRERSLPMGPGLYSLVSTGSISGSFCVLIGPARGCFCLCSLGAGSLFSEPVSSNAGTPSLSVLPADDGAPN